MVTVLLELGWESPNELAETVLELSNNLSGCPCPLTFDPFLCHYYSCGQWEMGHGSNLALCCRSTQLGPYKYPLLPVLRQGLPSGDILVLVVINFISVK